MMICVIAMSAYLIIERRSFNRFPGINQWFAWNSQSLAAWSSEHNIEWIRPYGWPTESHGPVTYDLMFEEYDARTGERIAIHDRIPTYSSSPLLYINTSWVGGLREYFALSDDGRLLGVPHKNQLKVFDTTEREYLYTFDPSSFGPFETASFQSHGRFAADGAFYRVDDNEPWGYTENDLLHIVDPLTGALSSSGIEVAEQRDFTFMDVEYTVGRLAVDGEPRTGFCWKSGRWNRECLDQNGAYLFKHVAQPHVDERSYSTTSSWYGISGGSFDFVVYDIHNQTIIARRSTTADLSIWLRLTPDGRKALQMTETGDQIQVFDLTRDLENAAKSTSP